MKNLGIEATSNTQSFFSSASFGKRLFATCIDLVLLTVLIFLIKIFFPDFANTFFFEKSADSGSELISYWSLNKISLFGTWLSYCTIMDCSKSKGTIGKQWMGISVSDENGHQIGFAHSMKRNISKILSIAPIGIGLLYIQIDKRNRAFHDILSDTVVLKDIS